MLNSSITHGQNDLLYGLRRNLYNNNFLNRVHNGVSMLELIILSDDYFFEKSLNLLFMLVLPKLCVMRQFKGQIPKLAFPF